MIENNVTEQVEDLMSNAKTATADKITDKTADKTAAVVAAAAAADTTTPKAKNGTNGTASAPAEGSSPDVIKLAPSGEPAPAGEQADEAPDEEEDTKEPLMYYVISGKVDAFKSASKAEKYLNQPGAPSEYTVVRGRLATAKKRVSLRR